MHPSAILDTLHFECVQTVKASNRLKKQESKTQCAQNVSDTKSAKNTPTHVSTVAEGADILKKGDPLVNVVNEEMPCPTTPPMQPKNTETIGERNKTRPKSIHEGCKTSRLQIMLNIAKVSKILEHC